ncbi:adenine phosphoribosyltransferase [Gordonia sp. HY002]|uniref:adenine phosphoribosyltransferase n=1 Tax=Gordonia zhenghanii TaxID=2911516 RepID=UPI001EF13EFF|nr:adenine phosphoribosyltransferase [Gordonia zhenghanii]MCF8569733.1 adenine phosphoribosyltransferase [Gordonia zhenghanii]MCF8603233.1 adenine phosphoribosyltransferase [Gordonia zhenghanii]
MSAGTATAEVRDRLESARAAIDAHARLVPDFPEPGVEFKDLTPVLAAPDGLRTVTTALADACAGADLIAGIDARGFLLGGAIAHHLGIGVVAVRKGGKLPPPVIGVDYDLEYGSARLEVPASGIDFAGRRVAVVDDVLATGGTLCATLDLLRQMGALVSDVAVVMELSGFPGRARIEAAGGGDLRVHNLCQG